MRRLTGILVIALVLTSCAKDVEEECSLAGALLPRGSVVDTIITNGGRQAVLTSTGACYYDTTFFQDSIPDPVDTLPEPNPERKVIMGFGSSTIARWDLEKAFSNKTMKKAGYKGAFIHQLAELTDTIRKIKPTQLILYAGSNDVIAGKTTSQVTVALQDLMRKIWNENPDLHITFITIHPSDTAFKVYSTSTMLSGIKTIEYVNANMTDWITTDQSHHASVVKSYSSFISWNPKRLAVDYFEDDKLHLNQTVGYPKLNELTRPKVQ